MRADLAVLLVSQQAMEVQEGQLICVLVLVTLAVATSKLRLDFLQRAVVVVWK
jgi:hypothetical protein